MTVDILFPYYGDVAMMKQAVLSVVGQTNPDWRLIVVVMRRTWVRTRTTVSA